MSRSVPVVESGVPEERARQGIQGNPSGTLGEFLHREVDVAFQDQGVDLSLPLRRFADDHRARIVRGATPQLYAGVNQEQLTVAERNVGAGVGVVDDGPIGSGSGDGGEAEVVEAFLAGVLFVQNPAVALLADRLARLGSSPAGA